MSALDRDRAEALQELMNIAFGHSVADLADLLGTHVRISVPWVNLVDKHEIAELLERQLEKEATLSVIQQAFRGDFFGQAFLAMFSNQSKGLIHMLFEDAGYAPEIAMNKQRLEALLEVGNMVIGACLAKFAELLKTTLAFDPPTVSEESIDSFQCLRPQKDYLCGALAVRANFAVDSRQVSGFLFLYLPKESIDRLFEEVDRFLETLE